MPIAAVPEYIGKQDLSQASPGLRFSMYLPIWTERSDQEKQIRKMARAKSSQGQELSRIFEREGMDAAIAHMQSERGRFPNLWGKNDHGAHDAWHLVNELRADDKTRMTALVERQQAIAQADIAGDALLVINGKATAPFTTGLGNEHPLENGFAFLWPYGLPYLPGSGIKGVLRQATRELARGDWGDTCDWDEAAIQALFGSEDSDNAQRGALTFWDVIPQIKGNSLMVEVMTPHQSHYYQQKTDRKTGNSPTPHDSGQPVPIYFLMVPPGSAFTFHVRCDMSFLRRIAPGLAEGDSWKTLTEDAFHHAFAWLGFGAKTAVGYGAMAVDEAAASARQQKQAEARAAAEQERQLAEATAGLPEDAAEIERLRREPAGQDNNFFLNVAEQLLTSDTPSAEAIQRLKGELERRWKGILTDPDATQGKKKKPKYKDRPKNLAKKLLELEARP